MKLERFEAKKETLLLANADYEARRIEDRSHRFNVRMVERHWKLKAGALVNFRANRKRRIHSVVSQLF